MRLKKTEIDGDCDVLCAGDKNVNGEIFERGMNKSGLCIMELGIPSTVSVTENEEGDGAKGSSPKDIVSSSSVMIVPKADVVRMSSKLNVGIMGEGVPASTLVWSRNGGGVEKRDVSSGRKISSDKLGKNICVDRLSERSVVGACICRGLGLLTSDVITGATVIDRGKSKLGVCASLGELETPAVSCKYEGERGGIVKLPAVIDGVEDTSKNEDCIIGRSISSTGI